MSAEAAEATRFWVEFFVPSQPVAQPRRLVVTVGGHGRSVEAPSRHPIHAWKSAVQAAAYPRRPPEQLTGPVLVTLEFGFQPPGNAILCAKTNPHLRSQWCITKPDRDNLDKAVLDALKQVGFYRDDCQVVDGQISKRYTRPWLGEIPGVSIRVEELEP